MDPIISKRLAKEMHAAADRVERGDCHMTNHEGMRMIETFSHEEMTKEQVLTYLRWSRAKFDQYVREGKMPRGKKRSGDSSLYWYRDEINEALEDLK